MPTRLPLDRLLVPVRQIGARVSVSKLARYGSALLFLPLAPAAADWEALPHAAMLRALHERKIRKAGDTLIRASQIWCVMRNSLRIHHSIRITRWISRA